ncbi:hypothetical protein BC830DRAFT_1163433, partial [Chytriomyces sp. MP71]
MHLSFFALAAVTTLLTPQHTFAFTNGTLLPEYICGPSNDGLPKTLGDVLGFAVFDKDTPLAFNLQSGNNLIMTNNTMAGKGGKPNTAYMLASFHNSLNQVTAQKNVITVMSTATLIPGQAFPLTLSSRGAGVPLDGALLYAQDSNGVRLGSFTDAGATFSNFAPCGVDVATNNPVGVVHHQIVSDNGVYSQLSWNAPANLQAGQVITIRGLAVDDMGFGTHSTTFTVGAAPAPNGSGATNATSSAPIPAPQPTNSGATVATSTAAPVTVASTATAPAQPTGVFTVNAMPKTVTTFNPGQPQTFTVTIPATEQLVIVTVMPNVNVGTVPSQVGLTTIVPGATSATAPVATTAPFATSAPAPVPQPTQSSATAAAATGASTSLPAPAPQPTAPTVIAGSSAIATATSSGTQAVPTVAITGSVPAVTTGSVLAVTTVTFTNSAATASVVVVTASPNPGVVGVSTNTYNSGQATTATVTVPASAQITIVTAAATNGGASAATGPPMGASTVTPSAISAVTASASQATAGSLPAP